MSSAVIIFGAVIEIMHPALNRIAKFACVIFLPQLFRGIQQCETVSQLFHVSLHNGEARPRIKHGARAASTYGQCDIQSHTIILLSIGSY